MKSVLMLVYHRSKSSSNFQDKVNYLKLKKDYKAPITEAKINFNVHVTENSADKVKAWSVIKGVGHVCNDWESRIGSTILPLKPFNNYFVNSVEEIRAKIPNPDGFPCSHS